jgi:ABC-type antimicrobial peptide transport system permease subunit
VLAFFMHVSPGWIATMRLPLLDGRDLRDNDAMPGAALINQTFARSFFPGENPIGKTFAKGSDRFEIVGVVADAPYRDLRETIPPQAYVSFHQTSDKGVPNPIYDATFAVRTSVKDSRALAAILRQEVSKARPELRVSNIRSMAEIMQAHTLRERLLARLAGFFAVVALVLATVGVYGVLDYSVLQRRREIGIRLALGARTAHVARGVTTNVLLMVLLGAVGGLLLGLFSARLVEALLYQTRPTDISLLGLPALTILGAALLAALPPVVRAVRIDPVKMLRAE